MHRARTSTRASTSSGTWARRCLTKRRVAPDGAKGGGVPEIHLVSVFIGPDGAGGNPLAVFLDGQAIPPARRLAVAAELGYSETVFVDDLDEGRIAIFVPTSELPFAGHPTVGTAWLLHEVGHPVATLRVAAGAVPAWRDAQWTWVRARPSWVAFKVNPNIVQMANANEVDALPGRADEQSEEHT